MILSDRSIRMRMHKSCPPRQRFEISGLIDDSDIQPSSIELRLGEQIKREVNPGDVEVVDITDVFLLWPGHFWLASTSNYVKIPKDLTGRVEGKSSFGRLGVMVHITAGYIDPGFEGEVTLEIYSVGYLPVKLFSGMKIAQLSLHQMTTESDRAYGSEGVGSNYQGQTGPTLSVMKGAWR